MSLYTLHQFKKLSTERQLDQLNANGVALDLAYTSRSAEAVLFAYHNFYVELLIGKYTDEILAVKCFKVLQKLDPYLMQINIDEITALLSPSK